MSADTIWRYSQVWYTFYGKKFHSGLLLLLILILYQFTCLQIHRSTTIYIIILFMYSCIYVCTRKYSCREFMFLPVFGAFFVAYKIPTSDIFRLPKVKRYQTYLTIHPFTYIDTHVYMYSFLTKSVVGSSELLLVSWPVRRLWN